MLQIGMGRLLVLAAGLCAPVTLAGQTAPTSAAPAPPLITVGQAAKWLTGPWKFTPGDSPWVNGTALWAQPSFDDRQWKEMSLAPQTGAKDPTLGTQWFVPGWTARGYPKLTGFAWYRLNMRVDSGGQRLSIDMPSDFDDAYQVYVNGQYVGEFGQFRGTWVNTYSALPKSFTLPPLKQNGDMVLALRFYMSPATMVGAGQPGGMHQPPVLGLPSMTGLVLQSEDGALLRSAFADLVMLFLYLVLAAPLALWAWRANRAERAWLWLFLVMTQQIVSSFLNVSGNLVGIPFWSYSLFFNVLFAPLGRPLWILFWWQWFGLQPRRWIPLTAWLLTAGRMLCEAVLSAPYFGNIAISQVWLARCGTMQSWMLGAQGLLLVVILVEGFRHEVTDALLASLPVGLLVLTTFPEVGTALSNVVDFYPYGIPVSAQSIVQLLLIAAVGALALRRFLRTRVRDELKRQALARDLEQAQQLQQRVLVPETVPSPYFSIEEHYLPAQTVGGDFFQMVAGADGSLLVVIGDVSGKGMSAAMLVAVLVGALCTRAKTSFDPAEMITTLNERLVGRGMGHLATCLAAELRPDGRMRIANAGHLSPYLNGEEISLEGSLPLGSATMIDPSGTTLQMEPGDVLTLLTDGVVEAMNGKRELFGFERAQAISRQPAASIARQAAEFGQEDDITVLRVEFVGAAREAPARETVPA